ncbi:hypothetical protein [Mycolicibacterium sp.]|uniref:hypothetical protein n=1 Tax=Mycolicibacterium sp. TaxID=2320850 RepID=UPI001A2ADB3F|nr:hypothetical protein [Mycolicibacterium sp.]MBJ7339576.1 hypothetical protein [Mycolicibacterium sp.]
MRMSARLTPSVGLTLCLAALTMVGVAGAPAAAAGCNDSSGTVVCAQGDIRGTDAPPPAMPDLGSYGSWCNANVCFPGNIIGGFVGP